MRDVSRGKPASSWPQSRGSRDAICRSCRRNGNERKGNL